MRHFIDGSTRLSVYDLDVDLPHGEVGHPRQLSCNVSPRGTHTKGSGLCLIPSCIAFVLDADDSLFDGVDDGLGAVRNTELVVDAGHMIAHGTLADDERPSDFFVSEALAH